MVVRGTFIVHRRKRLCHQQPSQRLRPGERNDSRTKLARVDDVLGQDDLQRFNRVQDLDEFVHADNCRPFDGDGQHLLQRFNDRLWIIGVKKFGQGTSLFTEPNSPVGVNGNSHDAAALPLRKQGHYRNRGELSFVIGDRQHGVRRVGQRHDGALIYTNGLTFLRVRQGDGPDDEQPCRDADEHKPCNRSDDRSALPALRNGSHASTPKSDRDSMTSRPRSQAGGRIVAHNRVEIGTRILLSKRRQGVRCIAVAALVDLVAAGNQTGHVRDGGLNHRQPIGSGRDQSRTLFLPGNVGHHQDHEIELKSMSHVHSSDHVADMWRIERSTKESHSERLVSGSGHDFASLWLVQEISAHPTPPALDRSVTVSRSPIYPRVHGLSRFPPEIPLLRRPSL